jgi:hypothetical protein
MRGPLINALSAGKTVRGAARISLVCKAKNDADRADAFDKIRAGVLSDRSQLFHQGLVKSRARRLLGLKRWRLGHCALKKGEEARDNAVKERSS